MISVLDPDHSGAADFVPDLEIEGLAEPADDHSAAPASVFAACRRETGAFLEQRLEAVFAQAHDWLFSAARDAASDEAQREYFDAMQELHRIKPAVRSSFLDGVLGDLERLWRAEVGGAPAPLSAQQSAEELSLVDTQSLDDHVRVMGIVGHARPRLRAGEHALAQRLSRLLPVAVRADDNPLGVESICLHFHAAVQNLGAERSSRMALFDALARTLVADLGELHRVLNELLAARGVLPGTAPAPLSPRAPHPGAPAPAAAPAAERREPAPAPPHAAAPPATGADAPLPLAAACDSARRLIALERELRGAPPAPPRAARDAEAEHDARSSLDAALARIQSSGDAQSWGERGPLALSVRVRAALAASGVELRDAALLDTLEVVSTLVDRILEDPLVEAGVKPLIRRLALVLLRAALADGAFFASESHPARQIVNRLGRLALPAAAATGARDADTAAEATAVVAEISAAAPAATRAFERAARSLDALLARQQARFERRVGALIDSLERQRALREARHPAAPESAAPCVPAGAPEAAQRDWQRTLESAARMESGSVVVLGTARRGPRPAQLVWHDPEREVFVFADGRGRRLASLARAELAMGLLRGAVRPAPAAQLAVLDRAMCSVLRDLHARLEEKSMLDALTGLANRKQFETRLARAMVHTAAGGRRHHVCLVGVESLGEIARRCGTPAADALVKQYAAVLQRQVGERGVVAHGERGRFWVLLEDSSHAETLRLMERHRRSVELSRCMHHGEAIEIAISIGIVAVALDASDPRAVLDAANLAFASARSGAGGGLHFQEAPAGRSPDGARSTAPAAPVSELIARGKLALRCQRVQPIQSGAQRLPYYEILLGVRDGDGRLGPPGDVILAAERSGEIGLLDRWIVEQVLRWMRDHGERLPPLQGFAINLSGGTLSDPGLPRFVLEALEATGVPPERVIFEVTESATIERLSVARASMETLRARGCRFALDDFGAGNASFSYLKLLPVDTVKIDGLFVKDMLANSADEAMVRSLHEIAHLLGKQTVAEFVEGEAVIDRLRELGVDYAQGFGIERPMALDALLSAAQARPSVSALGEPRRGEKRPAVTG